MKPDNKGNKSLISTQDWPKEELDNLMKRAAYFKENPCGNALKNRNLIMVFFDPSLRTRTSFEIAMNDLGGSAVSLNVGKDTWKLEHREGAVMDGEATEHIKDAARVLSRYGDAIAVRCFPKLADWDEDKKDAVISSFAKYASVPVINMESSLYHPCQALADIMAIKERLGSIRKKKFILAWSNHPKPLPTAVPNSAALIASMFGMDTVIAHPKGYELDKGIIGMVKSNCEANGSSFEVVNDMDEGLKGADIVYAKSWGSIKHYGKWDVEKKARERLKGWKITKHSMDLTNNAGFMHCLPVRRNVEVDDEVIDGKNSMVYDEAENRLHVQKALLSRMMGGGK